MAYTAGLNTDDLDEYPSAASPLTAMGLDPDEVAANPDLIAGINPDREGHAPMPGIPLRSAENPPSTSDTPAPAAATAAPASSSSSSAAEPSDAEGYAMAGLGQGLKTLKSAANSADEMSTEPPADLARLTTQREKLAVPAPRFDPKTGKQLDQTQEYDPTSGQNISINPKASTGQKVWRGVRGGLVGLMTGGVPGAVVGAVEPQDIRGGTAYNAPSKAYTQAEQRREEELGATDSSIKNAMQTWHDVNEARKGKASDYRATATLDKDIVTGATGLLNAENKPETEENKANAKLKLNQEEFQQRNTQADRLRLTGVQRTLFIANGKLPDPRQPTEGELALAQATKAFVAQNGRAPQTLDEFNTVASASKGSLEKISDADKTEAANLRAAAGSAGKHLKDLQDLRKHEWSPQGKQELDKKIKDAQDEYDDIQKQLTEKKPASAASAPATPAPAVAAPPAAAPPKAPAPPAANTPAKPQPSPEGTRIKLQNGTFQVKRNGTWVNE
jgi:hypothetical protein